VDKEDAPRLVVYFKGSATNDGEPDRNCLTWDFEDITRSVIFIGPSLEGANPRQSLCQLMSRPCGGRVMSLHRSRLALLCVVRSFWSSSSIEILADRLIRRDSADRSHIDLRAHAPTIGSHTAKQHTENPTSRLRSKLTPKVCAAAHGSCRVLLTCLVCARSPCHHAGHGRHAGRGRHALG
jgi:hypothetical protein